MQMCRSILIDIGETDLHAIIADYSMSGQLAKHFTFKKKKTQNSP